VEIMNVNAARQQCVTHHNLKHGPAKAKATAKAKAKAKCRSGCAFNDAPHYLRLMHTSQPK